MIDSFQDYFKNSGKLDEAVSRQALNRMKGLTNQNELANMMDAIDSIANDLIAEGFEVDEVAEYLVKIVTDKVMSKT